MKGVILLVGIIDILSSLVMSIALTEKQKTWILNAKKINPAILKYLKDKLEGLKIAINNEQESDLFNLMKDCRLKTTCFQTAESIAFFLNDDDYIERGDICLDGYSSPGYYHSWVCFKYDEQEYVLDACLNVLCTKYNYYKTFRPHIKTSIAAKDIKSDFLSQLTSAKIEAVDEEKQTFLCECNNRLILIDKKKREIFIEGSDDETAPLFANGYGYIPTIKKGKCTGFTYHLWK